MTARTLRQHIATVLNLPHPRKAALNLHSPNLAYLIGRLPPSSGQQQAVSLAIDPVLDTRAYALRAVSQDHPVGGKPQTAVPLATAGMPFRMRCAEEHGPGPANSFCLTPSVHAGGDGV